jgi:hypothetical protein
VKINGPLNPMLIMVFAIKSDVRALIMRNPLKNGQNSKLLAHSSSMEPENATFGAIFNLSKEYHE